VPHIARSSLESIAYQTRDVLLGGRGRPARADLRPGLLPSREELERKWKIEKTFEPHMSAARREDLYGNWKRAVERTFGWAR